MEREKIKIPEAFEELRRERFTPEVLEILRQYGHTRKWTRMSKLIKEHLGIQIGTTTLQRKYEGMGDNS